MKKTELSRVRKDFIYKTMLKEFTNYVNSYGWVGFCSFVPDALYEKVALDEHDPNITAKEHVMKVFLPELFDYRPEVYEDGAYWFRREDHVKMIGVFSEILMKLYSKMSWTEKMTVKMQMIFKF